MSVTLALLLLLPAALQEAPVQQEDTEAAYREDFADYTEISQMTDPTAQCGAYLDFLEEGVDERLLDYVASGTLQCMNAMTMAGNYDGVYPVADRLAELNPASAANARTLALQAAASASSSEMIVKYGEPFYQANPSSEVALLLAQSYGQLENKDKMLEYGQIVIDSGTYPMDQIWAIAYEVLQAHDRNGERADAVGLARAIRGGVTAAPEGLSASDWNSVQIYLLDLIARDDFDARRYDAALTSFDAILAIDSRNGKALYFKGNAMLQSGASVNQATQALAKAAVLEGNYSEPAMTLLRSTYASNAPGATADRYVQEALADARRVLGL